MYLFSIYELAKPFSDTASSSSAADTQTDLPLRSSDLTGLARELHVNCQMAQNFLHLNILRTEIPGSPLCHLTPWVPVHTKQECSAEKLGVRFE